MKTLADRLKERMRISGLTQECLAEKAEISQSSVHKLITGKAKESRKISRIAEALGVSTDWLVYGKGTPTPSASDAGLMRAQIIEWEKPEDLPDDKYVIVPRFKLKLSAGNGSFITEEFPGEPLAFTSKWIKEKGVCRSSLCLVNATGDSMEPTITDGSLLLIDIKSTSVIDGKVYALRYGEELRVKRLFKRYDGGLIIRSDNQHKYPDEVILPNEMNNHIYVIGRCIWQAGDL